MGIINRKTPRETALELVAEHQKTVAHWEAEKVTAQAELASLQERAGEEVLADPESAGSLTRSMQELRDRVDIAGRAVTAAQPKLDQAKRAVVLAEADEWDAEAARRRRLLDTHVSRTDALLAQLLEHEGRFVTAQEASLYSEPAAGQSHLSGSALKSGPLKESLEQAQRKAWVLREVAEGRDPQATLRAQASVINGKIAGLDEREYYPPSVWGPNAILPVQSYRNAVDAKHKALVDFDAHVADLPARIADMESRASEHKRIDGLPGARLELETAPERRAELVATLHEA